MEAEPNKVAVRRSNPRIVRPQAVVRLAACRQMTGLQGALPTLLSFSALLEELRSRKTTLAKAGSDAASIRGNVLQSSPKGL